MAAIHNSDLNVKEHLMLKMNELDKQNVERSTELLFSKKLVKELTDDKRIFDEKMQKTQSEVVEFKTKT